MLVLPALPACGIYGLSYVAERMGHHWDLHGNGIDGLVFLSWIVTPVIVVPIQAIALAIALPRLLKYPIERNLQNFLVTGFSIFCIVSFLALTTYVFQGSKN